jgi:SnoaL-like protein
MRSMDETRVRAMIEEYFAGSQSDPAAAHRNYHDDAVLEFPQSGERFEGVENFREWRGEYPASTSFELGEIRGGDDVWVMEGKVRYDDGPWNFGVSVHEFRGDRIARETIYFAEPFEAPAWRAQWRAAP